jgi:hypothetical protein
MAAAAAAAAAAADADDVVCSDTAFFRDCFRDGEEEDAWGLVKWDGTMAPGLCQRT